MASPFVQFSFEAIPSGVPQVNSWPYLKGPYWMPVIVPRLTLCMENALPTVLLNQLSKGNYIVFDAYQILQRKIGQWERTESIDS